MHVLAERKLEKYGVDAKKHNQYWGGVVGHIPDKNVVKIAHAQMGQMRRAEEFDGVLDPGTIAIVMGNSPTMTLIPSEIYKKAPVIGCNRALMHTSYPHWMCIADREPYCQERDSGRLEKAVEKGVRLLLSDSLFDPTVLLRGPKDNPRRWAQHIPEFGGHMYKVGPKRKKWRYPDLLEHPELLPVNTYSFEAPLVTCQNIVGSMLQSAMIMGAKTILCIGIELKWDSNGKSHFFGNGTAVGAYPQDGSINVILAALKQLKTVAESKGIKILNISPIKHTPFSKVFGISSIDKWLEKLTAREDWNDKTRVVGIPESNKEQKDAISLLCSEIEDE